MGTLAVVLALVHSAACTWTPQAPGSCNQTVECSPGNLCNADGICVPDGWGGIPPVYLMSFQLAAVVGCMSGLCCLWLALMFAKVMAYFRDLDTDRESDFMGMTLLVSCVGCLLLGFVVAFGLSTSYSVVPVPEVSGAGNNCSSLEELVCEPYYCDLKALRCYDSCTSDGECTSATVCSGGQCVFDESGKDIPGFRKLIVAPWVAALLGFTAATCCCCVFRCAGDSCPGAQRSVVGFLLALLGCLIGGLAVGLPLSGAIRIDQPNPGDGAMCTGSRACAPFFCDPETTKCFTQCTMDDHCIDGFSCDGGVCKIAETSHISTSRYSTGTVAGIAIAVGLVICCLCVCVMVFLGMMSDEFNERELLDAIPLCCCIGIVIGAVVALIVGLPISFATTGLDIPFDGNGTQCASLTAVGCEPFLCDVKSSRCFESCLENSMCSDGSRCSKGTCVPRKSRKERLYRPWVALETTLLMAIGLTACVWLSCYCASYRRDWEANTRKAVFSLLCTWCTCLALMFVIAGVPMLAMERTVSVETGPANGTVCTAGMRSSVCSPYLCDSGQRCATTCRQDNQCVEGHVCLNDKCTPVPTSLPMDKYNGSLLVATMMAAAFLAALLFLYAACRTTLPDAAVARAQTPAAVLLQIACSAMCVSLLVGLLFLLPLAYDERTVPPIPGGTGLACAHVEAVQCAPYLCDTRSSTCLQECAKSVECRDGSRCSKGECVPDDRGTFHALASVSGVLLVLFLCVIVIIPTYKEDQLIKLREADRETARAETALLRQQMEERVSQLDAFKARISQISRAVLDISPTAPVEHDPTVPTPSNIGDFPGVNHEEVVTVREPFTFEECDVCMAEKSTVRMVGRSCRHGFCDVCAKESLEFMVANDRFPAECPGCRAEQLAQGTEASLIPSDIIENLMRRGVLTTEFARRFINLQILKAFRPRGVITCPACEVLVAMPEEDKDPEVGGPEVYRTPCPNCGTKFCYNCNQLWFPHEGATCEEYAKKLADGVDDETTVAILRTSKECPNCSVSITHYKGHACHHIAPGSGCPSCRYHFCIVCLEKHPCSLEGHGLFCDDRCDCPRCPDCKPGKPCPHCPGNEQCPSCFPPEGEEPTEDDHPGPSGEDRDNVHLALGMEHVLPDDHDEVVATFVVFTGMDPVMARNFLTLFNWDVDLAVRYVFEMRGEAEPAE